MASVIVQKIKIKHAGNVIIDTLPPVGTVLINNGDGYTKNKKVSLSLNASDATTDIKDIEVRNIDINQSSSGESQTIYNFIPLEYEENFFWNLTDEEGHKKVEVKFRDYANNVSSYLSNSAVRKFFNIDTEEVEGLIRIGNDVFSSTTDEGRIYITRHYPKLIQDFDGETIKAIIENGNVLYVATNITTTSKIYSYLDGSFVSLNTFDSLIVDVASYDSELYVALVSGDLYKKDSSAWTNITTFSRTVLHIDGEEDYLYIIFNDSTDTIQIYNGTSFQEVDVTDLFPESEVMEESSSSESSSSSSSTRAESSSTQTNSTSSSSEKSRSTSSITASEISTSTHDMTSSSSSGSSSSSSTEEESSGLSSPSSESFSSESFLPQFSESSESTPAESSISLTSQSESTSSESSSESSSSSGDICDCGKYVDNSLYLDQIHFTNLRDIHTYQCNLFGRIVNLGDGWLRVLFYKNVDRAQENEIAKSDDFFNSLVNREINIVESNNTGVTGTFMYISLFSGTAPSNFVVLCEGTNTSSASSLSSSSTSSVLSSSLSQDVMKGSGTETDPFLVETAMHMTLVNANPEAYYRMVNNIDMSSVESSIMDEYIPIGSVVVPFAGYFDGYGHIVTGYNINRPTEDNIGLFGYTNNATIRRLGLYEPYIVGKDSVGSIAGRVVNTTIEQCFVHKGTVTGEDAVGGLVGYADENSDLINNYSRNDSLVGTTTVGGLIGYAHSSASVVFCYSTSFNLSMATNKGGLIGESGISASNWESFNIDADLEDSEGEVINSYWDIETTGVLFSSGGTGKLTFLMKIESTFIVWDFDEVWNIAGDINNGYPYLIAFLNPMTNSSSSSSTEGEDTSSSGKSSSSLYMAPSFASKIIGKEITW